MKSIRLLLCFLVTSATSAFSNPALPFDTPPRAVKTVAASTPSGSETAGLVSLLITVTVDGTVADAKVLKSSRPEFEAAATEAVMKWKFTPAEKGGQAIEAKIVVPIRFSLEATE